MDFLVEFIRLLLFYFLSALSLALLLRAIFSWFDPEQSSRFSVFLMMITEPFILPIRQLCHKNNWFQQTPLDIPYLITVLLVWILQTVVELL